MSSIFLNMVLGTSRKKNVIAFVDGDRGGELILKELLQVADIDYIARAPPGREVEEKVRVEEQKAVREEVKVKVPEQILKGIDEVRGKGEAIIYGNGFKVIKRTSVGELAETLQKLDNVRAIVFDGVITQRLVDVAGEKGVEYIIGAVRRGVAKCPVDLSVLTFEEVG